MSPEQHKGRRKTTCREDGGNLFPTSSSTKYTAREGRAGIINAWLQVSFSQTYVDYMLIVITEALSVLEYFYLWLPADLPCKMVQMLRLMMPHMCQESMKRFIHHIMSISRESGHLGHSKMA